MKVTTCSHFLLVILLVFSTIASAQHLTISASGETGTSGTNWSITGNILNVAASGSANVHPSVITNHLSNIGSLTITLSAQASVTRDIYINNTIAYTGSNARTLTINAANDLIVASGVSITSSTAAMNLVLRSIFSAGVPDHGRIQLNGTTINTNGGHFWAGGGSGNSTWNGLTVGNTYSRTWADDVAGISFIGSTLNTNGGGIYMAGLSYNTSDGDGENYGVNIRNSAITSGTGQIDILGDLKGMYGTGSGLGIFGNEGPVSISATSGAINLTGTGVDQAGTNTGWRRGLLLYTLSTSGIYVTSTSGNISITGSAAFPTNTNDDMVGIQLGSTQAIADGVKITSQTGNIILAGSNSRENAGQNSNAVQFIAANTSNSIRVGYDGTNANSGNITIEGNSIIQNNVNAGSGSISVQSTGTLTIRPSGDAFTYLRSSTSGSLLFDDDWNFGTNLGGFVYGKTTNTTNLTYSSPLTTAGPISIYSGDLIVQQNLTSSLSNAAILLQATGRVELSASRTIQSNGGDITLRASSGGSASNNTRAIYLNTASQILSNGGNITLGGGYAGSEGSLYAATNIAGGGYAITLLSATLNAAGGNIKLYGRNVSSYGDGIYLSDVSVTTTGSGTIGIYGDSYGGYNGTSYFGGVTFANNASTIQTVNGNLTLKGILTESQSSSGYGINFYRSPGSAGLTNHIQILSQTGNIQVTGDRGATTGGGIGHSSWGHVYFGSPASNSFTASGSVTLTYSSLVIAGANGFKVKTSGAVTYEPAAASFVAAQDFPPNIHYVLADGASSLTIGKTTNTSNIDLLSAISIAGPISVYGGNVYLWDDVASTNGSNITILGSSSIYTSGSGSTSRDLTTAGGTIRVEADSDANGAGLLNIDYMSFNSGSGPVIIRGETVSWETGVESNKPFINTTGTFTYESNDAAFGQDVSLVWFKIANGTGGITIGKTTNTYNVNFNSATALTVNGPVNVNGATLSFTTALTVTNSDLTLRSSAAVTQSAAIIAAGLSLNGTGTFTLTNTSNNFTTLAGGAVGTLLGATQVIDVSGGLTIGTVGSNIGLTGSSTLRVETLAGDLTLAGSISTTSTSTDAVILTAAKSTAIGVPTDGDILVSGSPTITMGTGAIAKLFSGYDVTSTGLTTLAGGPSNARYNYDETTTTFNPTLSANNKYAIYRTALGYGDLTIVSSGADAEGTTWTYVNGVITTTSGTANVLNTVVQTKLNAANLSIEANKITFSANVTGTNSNSLSLLSKTHIVNTNATTITTLGGNVLLASNVDDATDNETTANGYILFGSGLTITTNGGNITLGGGNVTGTDYALGTSAYPYEGIRVDNTLNLNSGGGNINMRGKSYAISTASGAWGVGFWNLSTGSIASGAGAITLDGFSQSSGGSLNSGLYSFGALTITSENTTADAIQIIGKSTGNGGESWSLETDSAFSLLATGTGGGITVSSSQQNSANNYDIVFRGETNILAKSGPINLLGRQSGGIANGTMFLGNNLFLGSKASSAVPTSSSNITVQYDMYNFNNIPAKLATSGTFNWKPASTSFGQDVATDFFSWSQNGQTLTGLTIGKSGNAGNIYLRNAITVAGPISVYGNYVEVSSTITSSATGDILLKGIVNSGSCVNISGGITKSSGTGTLTMQGHGRVQNTGTITTSGTGVLNVIFWSDFDGDDVGGGSTLGGGSISTNGGHIWMGGNNSNGGSYSWNGLTVGDGPSTGASGANCNAIDLFGAITSAGGDVLFWASNNGGCGISGIQSDGTRLINAGSGDITLIALQTGGAIELTSTGVISLLPNAGSYAGALTLGGTLTSGNFTFNTSYYNGLKINSLANSGLVIGNYSGHLNGATAVTQGNSSNVTVSSALSTKSMEIYGGAIALNESLTTSGVNADMIIKGTSNINLAASKTITTAGGDVNLWADSDDNSTGYVQLLSSAAINSNGGDINLGGGSSLATDYAFGTTAETCPEAVATQYISGIHLRQSSSLNSGGGNISLRGQNANTANAAMSFGVSLRGVTMNSGTGKIAINGIANGSGSVNAQAVASWGTLTLRSASTSTDAIAITGNALSSVGASSLGINVVALFEATGVGGGITITGKSGVASTNASVNIGGDILAVSGPITISGENISGAQDNIFMGSTTIIGKKSGTNVTSSTSNVILEGNRITTTGSVLVDCSGTLTVQPFGSSFASAISWPMTNVTHASSLSGLTIGKTTNTSNVTFANATTIGGPITAYGGAITVSAAVAAAGNILLDGDPGSFLTQDTKGVTIGAAVTTSSNGNITILGRGGSGNAQFGNFGVQITQTVEAGGSGTIAVTGIGGLSSDGPSGSSHGVNLDGSSAWIKSNGGNVTVTGNGGGANSGSYSQGVVMLNSSRISAGGSGILTITGTGGVNTIIGLRGVVINSGSVFTAGGAININGYHGTNGTDNSDGFSMDNATVGSNTSGPITIVGTAGGGTGSEAISMSTTNTIGGASQANNIVLRGNNLALAGTNSVLTTGQVTIEPYSNSFTSALSFPISNLSLANTISGLTLGKSTNTANVTFGATTTIAGPITVYGGTVAINAALTATNSNINLTASTAATQTAAITANGLALNGAGIFTLENTANNIVTIAGGSSAAKIGSLSFVDAAGGLEIGTVNPTGITSTGPIKIETLEGNITLSKNLATEDTTADAIILNAGKTAAIGTATGGDIIVSGTPTLTFGTGGLAKLFSGRNSNSTGLTTLVGGAGNKRVSVDETTVTFSPVLAVNTSYALYRADDKLAATISNFNNFNKMYFDGSFTIELPTSDSTGAFSYTSSNPAVATISGTTVTILSEGTSTITANQAADVNYDTASAAATLTVSSVSVLTKGGGISSTNLNYVNKYGQIGGNFGLSANGGVLNAKTPEPSNAETGLVLNLDASNSASYSGTGTTWNDISGNNYNCALSGGVSFATDSGISTFNFSSGYGAVTLPKTTSMTYFVWAKSSVACSTPYMVLFHSGTTFATPEIGPSLFFRACYNYWNTQDGPGNPFSNGNYSTHGTNWHNYIVVNDAVANTTKLYYDGVLIGSAVYKHSSNTNLTIGNSSNLNAPWKGGIATFKAYNKALTDSEISNLYNSTKGVFGY